MAHATHAKPFAASSIRLLTLSWLLKPVERHRRREVHWQDSTYKRFAFFYLRRCGEVSHLLIRVLLAEEPLYETGYAHLGANFHQVPIHLIHSQVI